MTQTYINLSLASPVPHSILPLHPISLTSHVLVQSCHLSIQRDSIVLGRLSKIQGRERLQPYTPQAKHDTGNLGSSIVWYRPCFRGHRHPALHAYLSTACPINGGSAAVKPPWKDKDATSVGVRHDSLVPQRWTASSLLLFHLSCCLQ